jgi:predicted RNase H-like nuclease
VIAGVDGCRGGWVVVSADGARFVERFADIGRARMLAVDMPIGLPRMPGRACDRLARVALGKRSSTIFSPPARGALDAGGYAETCAANRATSLGAPAISLQMFHLLPKIREIDAVVTPFKQRRIREAHPELAFAFAAGRALPPKKTPAGQRARRQILAALGLLPEPVRGAAPDDLLDAAILCWTAQRLVDGTALVLGGERDERGLRMEITA